VLAGVLTTAARGRWRRARTAAAPTRRRRGRGRGRGGRCAAAASETVFFLKSSGGNGEGRVGEEAWARLRVGEEAWARLRVTYVQRYILALLCRGAFALRKRLLKLLAPRVTMRRRSTKGVGTGGAAYGGRGGGGVAWRWNRRDFTPGCAACPSLRSSAPPAAAAGPCCHTPAHSSVNRGKLNPIGYMK
jgi:hypothetical protein